MDWKNFKQNKPNVEDIVLLAWEVDDLTASSIDVGDHSQIENFRFSVAEYNFQSVDAEMPVFIENKWNYDLLSNDEIGELYWMKIGLPGSGCGVCWVDFSVELPSDMSFVVLAWENNKFSNPFNDDASNPYIGEYGFYIGECRRKPESDRVLMISGPYSSWFYSVDERVKTYWFEFDLPCLMEAI